MAATQTTSGEFDLSAYRQAAEERNRGLVSANLWATILIGVIAFGFLAWKWSEFALHGLDSYQGLFIVSVVGTCVFFAFWFGVTWYSMQPGGRTIRIGPAGITVVYDARHFELYSWAGEDRRFRIYDYTGLKRPLPAELPRYKLQGVRPWSRLTQLTDESAAAIFEWARRSGVAIQTHPPSAWDGFPRGLILHDFTLSQRRRAESSPD